jgi:threonine/homoserine/homoserine lactone efflux protein
MKKSIVSPGIFALVLIFLVGIWLVIAPYVMETQQIGAAWSAATIDDIAAGGLLIVASLAGALISIASGLREALNIKEEAQE